MIRIGILGNIGSGKSYIAKSFGMPVFNADEEVAKIYKTDKKIFKKLKKILPKYIHKFPVNKDEISKAILEKNSNLKKIITIVHLEIRKKMSLYRQQPVIAILSSGDELVEVGTIPKAGQLINSNSVFLAEALANAGAKVVDLGIIPDKKGALISALEAGYAAHTDFDMVVCTGGASVGNHDHIASDLIEDSASKIDFWRIAMRPGKPLIAASWQEIPFLGLPGNPVSAGVCTLIFVLPALRYFLGLKAQPDIHTLHLDADLPENDRRQDYIRAVYTKDQDGRVSVKPLGKQDSSMLRNFCHADALILRPPFAKAAQQGEAVPVIEIDTRL